ncbi:uncharacterized protein METZ01_LOCUS286781, partial [marine metagenome]
MLFYIRFTAFLNHSCLVQSIKQIGGLHWVFVLDLKNEDEDYQAQLVLVGSSSVLPDFFQLVHQPKRPLVAR